MARKLRVEFPGAIYHVMSCGDRRENIFCDDFDHERFLQTWTEVCLKTGWQVHAYCLMRNHFHLVIETPRSNLVAGMKWFLGTYTTRFNHRHKLTGHLFSGRYKSQVVSSIGGYLRTVCDYVHLNPVRARLLAVGQSLRSFRWSSFPAFVAAVPRPPWLRVDRVFGECGVPQDTAAGRQEFERRLEKRRTQETEKDFDLLRRNWCFGDDQFKAELLSQISTNLGAWHYGEEVHEAAAFKAERLIAEELQRLRWTEDDLASTRKGHPAKVAVARRLRAETTMTVQWIADRLRMGAKTHLAHLLYWQKRREGDSALQTAQQYAGSPSATTTPILLTDPLTFDPSFD